MRAPTYLALALTLPLTLASCSGEEADTTTEETANAPAAAESTADAQDRAAPDETAAQSGTEDAQAETSDYVRRAVDFANRRFENAGLAPFGTDIVVNLPADIGNRAGVAGEIALTMSNMAPDESLTLHVMSGTEPARSMPSEDAVECTVTVSANTVDSNSC